ncbi:PadR family transcriptional regulator [Cellulosimicrobium cellulans]|uniref:PadR family transcriptional regulator n=1 Tax=Cellulosimicrobium cellulans TaxID=1710 RepID=UPI00130DEFD6|nr:PadR family transcriptional regulator [Cellulosimicrobium cellulans]
MQGNPRTAQLRKGVLELAILAVLSREECYSLGIIDRLGAHPALTATPGTVYPLLARLEKAGLVGSRWGEAVGGPPRKYYWLTPDGRSWLSEGSAAWSDLGRAMAEILREVPT